MPAQITEVPTPQSTKSETEAEPMSVVAWTASTVLDGVNVVFDKAWLVHPKFRQWLVEIDGKAKCTVCSSILNVGWHGLHLHRQTEEHKTKMDAAMNVKRVTCTNRNYPDVEAAMCAFLLENNIPLANASYFLNFLKTLPEKETLLKVTLGREKAAYMIVEKLWPHFNKLLAAELNSKFFSIIVDETVDVQKKRQVAIMAVHFDQELFKTKVDILNIAHSDGYSAEGVFTSLEASLQEWKVNTDKWVGFWADTADVDCAVSASIRKNYPRVQVINVSCHVIHYCASEACKFLPNSLEDLCRTVYNHFNSCQPNTETYAEFQQFYDEKPHELLRPHQTRWISLQPCVTKIIDKWDALLEHWTQLTSKDPTHANASVLRTLQNPFQRCEFLFLSYVLGLFHDFNEVFQSEVPLFYELRIKVEELLKTLHFNIFPAKYVQCQPFLFKRQIDTEMLLQYDQVYIGVEATAFLAELNHPPGHEAVYIQARAFYIECIRQINMRFNFDSDLYQDSSFLLPHQAQVLSPATLFHIKQKYLGPEISAPELDKEWRTHILIPGLSDVKDISQYWRKVCGMRSRTGKKKFPHLGSLVCFFMTLPYSRYCVDRLSSKLQSLRADIRNSLGDDNTVGMICTKDGMKRTGVTSIDMLRAYHRVAKGPIPMGPAPSHSGEKK